MYSIIYEGDVGEISNDGYVQIKYYKFQSVLIIINIKPSNYILLILLRKY